MMEKRNNKSGAKCNLATTVFSFISCHSFSLFLDRAALSSPTKIRVSLKLLGPPGVRLIATRIKYTTVLFTSREEGTEDFIHSTEIIMEFQEMIHIVDFRNISTRRGNSTKKFKLFPVVMIIIA